MKLNNIERVVDFSEPTDIWSGVYNVDTNYQGSVDKLDRASLFDILAKEGLDYSGIDYDIQHGFNDRNVMGVKEAEAAKAEGRSNIWIGFGRDLINLEICPKTFKGLKSQTHLEYAQRILETVVTFVETPSNYQK